LRYGTESDRHVGELRIQARPLTDPRLICAGHRDCSQSACFRRTSESAAGRIGARRDTGTSSSLTLSVLRPELLVIGHYRMGFEITPSEPATALRVFIDYALPDKPAARWLGHLFATCRF